jgi:hypothetical protein
MEQPPRHTTTIVWIDSYLALSIIHTDNLPNSHVSTDNALTHFETNISPWKTPAEYIDAEANHVNTIIPEIRMLTGKAEIEQACFNGQPMIYSVSCGALAMIPI